MADYKKMYAILCKAIDDAIDPLEQIPETRQIANDLQIALLEAEDIYIETTLYAKNEQQIIKLSAEKNKSC